MKRLKRVFDIEKLRKEIVRKYAQFLTDSNINHLKISVSFVQEFISCSYLEAISILEELREKEQLDEGLNSSYFTVNIEFTEKYLNNKGE